MFKKVIAIISVARGAKPISISRLTPNDRISDVADQLLTQRG